jgi:hypothetical protein
MSATTLDYIKKQKTLQELRHEIKKKRLLFDEGKEKFGMDELSQLMKVKNTSEVKGYPLRASKGSNLKVALKIVPIETKYEKEEHPCHLEHIILKELTDNIVNKNISPHVAHFLGVQKVSNKSRALKHLNLKRLEVEEKIRTHSSMLIAEYVEGGSLDNWIFNTYEDDKEIDDITWRNIIFQLIYTLAVLQHYYKLMHNDFHYGNILIDNTITPGGYFVYEINNEKYYLPNTGISPKIWDLEFAMSYTDKIKDAYPNKFIIGPHRYDRKQHKTIVENEEEVAQDYNVPYNYNQVYDLHYVLTSLLDLYISQEIFDWIIKLYPQELIPDDESSYESSLTLPNSDNDSDSESDSDNDSDNESDSESDSDSDSDNDSESKSDSDKSTKDKTKTETKSETDSDSETENQYIDEGRLINGMEKMFDLPTPLQLLEDPLFESFKTKPQDFDEKTAVYFKAGF